MKILLVIAIPLVLSACGVTVRSPLPTVDVNVGRPRPVTRTVVVHERRPVTRVYRRTYY